MTETSSIDLANSLVSATPAAEDDKRSYEALSVFAGKGEFSRDDRFAVAFEAALSRIDPAKDAARLGAAGSFLAASGLADISPVDVAARHLLSLVKMQSEPVGDLSPETVSGQMTAGTFSPDTAAKVSSAMVDLSLLSDDDLSGISSRVSPDGGGLAGRVFPPVIAEDVEKARKVMEMYEGLDPFEAKVSRAVDVLDADKSDDRLIGAVTRVFADKRVFGEEQDVSDMAVRLASDVTVQIRAAEIVSKIGPIAEREQSPEAEIDFAKIAALAYRNEAVRKDLQAESEGRFSDLSRTAALDVRADIVSGDAIPFMTNLLRMEASRREASRSAAISAQAAGIEF